MLQTIRYSVPDKRNKRMRGLQMNRCKASFVYSGMLQAPCTSLPPAGGMSNEFRPLFNFFTNYQEAKEEK